MPDPVDLDLGELTRHRQELASVTAEQTALRVELAASQPDARPAAPNGHRHRGARRCRARRRRSGDATGRPPRPAFGADRGIGDLATGLLVGRDIGDSVGRSTATSRSRMLPVRIETRFAAGPARRWTSASSPIRCTSTPTSPSSPTTSGPAAEWYWSERWPALDDGDVAEQAWQTLAGRFRPGRARYLRRDAAADEHRRARPMVRRRSPTRHGGRPRGRGRWRRRPSPSTGWPIGFQAGEEVFRVWSERPVPDRLAAGPTPDAPKRRRRNHRTTPSCPHVQDAFRWALDLDAARDAGMALTVTRSRSGLRSHPRPRPDPARRRRRRLDADARRTPPRRWRSCSPPTPPPATSPSSLPARRRTTPGRSAARFSTAPSEQVAEWAPPVDRRRPGRGGRRRRRSAGGGVGGLAGALAAAPGAGGTHHRTESALVDALWEATGGYYLRELLDPLAPRRPHRRAARARRRARPSLRPAADDPGRPAALRRAARRRPAATARAPATAPRPRSPGSAGRCARCGSSSPATFRASAGPVNRATSRTSSSTCCSAPRCRGRCAGGT